MIVRVICFLATLTAAPSSLLHAVAPTSATCPTRLELAPEHYPPHQHVDSTSLNKLALSIKVFVSRDILFPIDSIEIDEASVRELNRLTRELSMYPTAIIHCLGHTDNFGSEEYNFALGLQRAQAVKDFILAAGIAEERLSVKSLGETQPTVPNDTPANRAKNRRVSLEFSWEPEPTKQATRQSPPQRGGMSQWMLESRLGCKKALFASSNVLNHN